jgi:hypothetical protein
LCRSHNPSPQTPCLCRMKCKKIWIQKAYPRWRRWWSCTDILASQVGMKTGKTETHGDLGNLVHVWCKIEFLYTEVTSWLQRRSKK